MSQAKQDIGPPSLRIRDFGKIPFLSLNILFFKGFKLKWSLNSSDTFVNWKKKKELRTEMKSW